MINIIGSTNNREQPPPATPTTAAAIVSETPNNLTITTQNSINKTIDTSKISTLAGQLSQASDLDRYGL